LVILFKQLYMFRAFLFPSYAMSAMGGRNAPY
jgi:hypothetical protein